MSIENNTQIEPEVPVPVPVPTAKEVPLRNFGVGLEPGKTYLFRTTLAVFNTEYLLAVFHAYDKRSIIVEPLAVITDTGPFKQFLASGEYRDGVTFPIGSKLVVNSTQWVEALEWPHA